MAKYLTSHPCQFNAALWVFVARGIHLLSYYIVFSAPVASPSRLAYCNNCLIAK